MIKQLKDIKHQRLKIKAEDDEFNDIIFESFQIYGKSHIQKTSTPGRYIRQSIPYWEKCENLKFVIVFNETRFLNFENVVSLLEHKGRVWTTDGWFYCILIMEIGGPMQ